MNTSKNSYYYEFHEGYCAGAATSHFCKEAGKPTSGAITGKGWGPTPNAAKRAARAGKVISGNVDIEWVLHHERLFKNGKLIKESF